MSKIECFMTGCDEAAVAQWVGNIDDQDHLVPIDPRKHYPLCVEHITAMINRLQRGHAAAFIPLVYTDPIDITTVVA